MSPGISRGDQQLWLPARGDFKQDSELHKRNLRALETWAETTLSRLSTLEDVPSTIDPALIDSGTLNATLILAGIIRTAAAGQQVQFGPDGIFLYDETGNTILSIPVSGFPFVKGTFDALGITIQGNMTIRGTSNIMESGAELRFEQRSGSNPQSAPSLTMVWDVLTELDGVNSFLAYRSSGFGGGATYLTANQNVLKEWNLSGTLLRSKEFRASGRDFIIWGIAELPPSHIIIGVRGSGQQRRELWKLDESDLARVDARDAGIFDTATLTYDSLNNQIVMATANDGGVIGFRKFSTSLVLQSLFNTSGVGNPSLLNPQLFDATFDGTNIWLSYASFFSVSQRADPWAPGGGFQQNRTIRIPGGPYGFTWDGSTFRTLKSSGEIVEHTSWDWTTESDKYWVAHTWVDDNGASSAGARPLGAGDFETVKSPTSFINLLRRGKLQITVPPLPAGVTHVGLYVDRGAAEPTLDYVADKTTAVSTIDGFTAGGAAPPGTSTFPSTGGVSKLVSDDGSPLLRADGYSRAKFEQGTNQTFSDGATATLDFASGTTVKDTDSYLQVANDRVAFPFTGQYLVIASARWEANGTGRRRLEPEESPDGSAWSSLQEEGLLAQAAAVTGGGTTLHSSAIIDATAGHFMRLRGFQNSGGNLDIEDWTLNVLFVGPS